MDGAATAAPLMFRHDERSYPWRCQTNRRMIFERVWMP